MDLGVSVFCLVTLWILIPVIGDGVNPVDPQVQSDHPKGQGQDQCGMISHIQSAIIQILNNHYEYGKGIHKLHGIVDHVQEDMVTLKSKLNHMDSWTKTVLTNNVDIESEKPYKDKETQDYIRHIQDVLGKKVLAGKLSVGAVRNLDTELPVPKAVQDTLANLSALVESQDERLRSLEKKYKTLRRSIRQTLDNMKNAAGPSVSPPKQETDAVVEHLVHKQKEINAHLERRVLELENDWKQWQADGPALTTACPPNFVRHMSSCYRFYNTSANWVDAEKHCQQLHPNSHLVSIETKEEEQYLVTYRQHNKAWWTSHYLWTGASDMTHEGQWTWVGTGAPLSYTHWRPGQPNNHHGDQHCMYFFADSRHDNHWDDWHCRSANLNFVCEVTVLH